MRRSPGSLLISNPLFVAGFVLLGALSGTSAAHAQEPTERYLVQPGDTLTGIAGRYGADVDAITALNGLADPNNIPSDTYLLLPVSQAASAGPSEASEPTMAYEVASGDTLSGLALRFGVTVDEIVAANRLASADQIVAGDRLRIEPATAKVPEPQTSIVDEQPATASVPEPQTSIVDEQPATASVAEPRTSIVDEQPATAPQLVLAVAPKTAVAEGSIQPNPRVLAPAVAAVAPQASARVPEPMQATAARSPGPVQGRIVSVAAQYVGFPYVFGGDSPSGFDCSGFIQFVLNAAGSPFPRDLHSQYGSGPHPSRVELAPGDLVFFQDTYIDGLSHNGIYVGGGRFVHAVDEEKGVAVSNLNDTYWTDRWFGATRIA